MKIGIISSKRTLYSTKRLAESARKRKHDVRVINPLQCMLSVQKDRLHIQASGLPIHDFDLIIPRIGASLTDYGVALLTQFELRQVPVLNTAQSIAMSRDKLISLQHLAAHGLPVPRTAMARCTESLLEALEFVGSTPVILKMLCGTQGIGVIKADSIDSALSTAHTLWRLGESVLIQEFIADCNGKDLRAFVVGDRVVAAMHRSAADSDFRSNLHRGGTSTPATLNEDEQSLALAACRALNLQVAGVDMLQSERGPLIIEVNSSPGLEGIENTTGRDIAKDIIKFIEAMPTKTR